MLVLLGGGRGGGCCFALDGTVCSECSEEVGEEGALSGHCGIHESVLLFSHIKERKVEEGK